MAHAYAYVLWIYRVVQKPDTQFYFLDNFCKILTVVFVLLGKVVTQ